VHRQHNVKDFSALSCKYYQETLTVLFEIIRDNREDWDDESIKRCKGLYQNLKDLFFYFSWKFTTPFCPIQV
jgi:hypothetical protein